MHTSRTPGKYAFARVANFVNKYVYLNLSWPVSMEAGKFVKRILPAYFPVSPCVREEAA